MKLYFNNISIKTNNLVYYSLHTWSMYTRTPVLFDTLVSVHKQECKPDVYARSWTSLNQSDSCISVHKHRFLFRVIEWLILGFDIQKLPASIPLDVMYSHAEYAFKYTDWEEGSDIITPMGRPSSVRDTVHISSHGESISPELLLIILPFLLLRFSLIVWALLHAGHATCY